MNSLHCSCGNAAWASRVIAMDCSSMRKSRLCTTSVFSGSPAATVQGSNRTFAMAASADALNNA
ncbi:hypothetical protein D3C77_619690 [compost metagenome]